MEEALSERHKAFVAAHRSDKDRQVCISALDTLRLSSPRPRPRLKHGRRLALLSRPNLTLNLYTLFFAQLLALLPPFLTFPTVPLPANWLWSLLITRDLTFLSLSQRPCVVEPEATFPNSAKPRTQRSLTCPSAHPFPPLNFLRLRPTSLSPLPLAQTKLPIPC